MDKWKELRKWLIDYREEKTPQYVIGNDGNVYSAVSGRYCVAISIDDLLEKMDELEGRE